MARIRRLAVLVGAVALTGAFVAGPAQADAPEVLLGDAAGTVLDLSVLGTQASVGSSSATVNSVTGTSKSAATGILLPSVLGAHSDVKADAAPGESESSGRVCKEDVLPPELSDVADILNLGVVCGSADADNTSKGPSASAEGSIAELDVSVSSVVSKIEEVAAENGQNVQIGDKLAGLLGDVCTDAGSGGTPGAPAQAAVCNATTTLTQLVETVLKTQAIDVELGKSSSSVTTGPSTVTSEATAAGGTIKILPSPQVAGDKLSPDEPLVTISIGDAKATTVYDRGVGSATADADPAIVRIKFNSKLIETLAEQLDPVTVTVPTTTQTVTVDPGEALEDEIIVGPSTLANLMPLFKGLEAAPVTPIAWCNDLQDSVCILPGTPLESRVWFASERETVNPDGSAEAEANAVRVDLLVGTADDIPAAGAAVAAQLTDPVVHLALAHAEAAVGGRQAQVNRTTDDDGGCTPGTPNCPKENDRSGGPGSTEPPLELPRTGGIPLVPMLGSAGLALSVLLRRAMVKASR